MKKRKLKPIPKLIFNFLRVVFFGLIAAYLGAYFICLAVITNAEQMERKYDYLIETQNVESYEFGADNHE